MKWPDFSIDRTLLKQILQNLISNGVKFNERNPKRIEIGWQAAPGDTIDIFVCDNGIGIEPQYREQIFRIFQRLHTDRAYEGTGIGLAIVQKAVNKLGGTVRLESEPGKGSTFTLRLPRKPPEMEKGAVSGFPGDDFYY
jgi:signal transduction histidine kinase